MDNKPPLRLVGDTPWNKPAAYRPDCVELLRQRISRRKPSFFRDLFDDFRDVMSEVRGSPYSHALVALLTIISWTAVLVVPTLVLR